MRKMAEEHAADDKKRKEDIETVNEADSLVYTTEKTLKDMEGKVADDKLTTIKDGIAELKKLLESKDKDVAAIKKKFDDVQKLIQDAATEMYQKARTEYAKTHPEGGAKGSGAEQPGPNEDESGDDEPSPKKAKGKVVDADYEVEGKKKKAKK
jgi:molecular chaperone DnaK